MPESRIVPCTLTHEEDEYGTNSYYISIPSQEKYKSCYFIDSASIDIDAEGFLLGIEINVNMPKLRNE